MKEISANFDLDLSESYPIYLASQDLGEMLSNLDLSSYSSIFILTDQNVAKYYLTEVEKALNSSQSIIVTPSELSKSIDCVSSVSQKLLEAQADRHSLLVNLGGGMVGDLGGFIASIFMRGIDFIHIPTTLLSQVDSSIGGKVGINHGGAKNILGSFVPPRFVVISCATLGTLSDREYSSGYGEIIKYGCIADQSLLEQASYPAKKVSNSKEVLELIERSCTIKNDIVKADTNESDLRKILNFGHTVGHALEILSHKHSKPLLHGEAVALGLIVEVAISNKLLGMPSAALEQLETIIDSCGLPSSLDFSIQKDHFIKSVMADKKNIKGSLRCVLLEEFGEPKTDIIVDPDLLYQTTVAVLGQD